MILKLYVLKIIIQIIQNLEYYFKVKFKVFYYYSIEISQMLDDNYKSDIIAKISSPVVKKESTSNYNIKPMNIPIKHNPLSSPILNNQKANDVKIPSYKKDKPKKVKASLTDKIKSEINSEKNGNTNVSNDYENYQYQPTNFPPFSARNNHPVSQQSSYPPVTNFPYSMPNVSTYNNPPFPNPFFSPPPPSRINNNFLPNYSPYNQNYPQYQNNPFPPPPQNNPFSSPPQNNPFPPPPQNNSINQPYQGGSSVNGIPVPYSNQPINNQIQPPYQSHMDNSPFYQNNQNQTDNTQQNQPVNSTNPFDQINNHQNNQQTAINSSNKPNNTDISNQINNMNLNSSNNSNVHPKMNLNSPNNVNVSNQLNNLNIDQPNNSINHIRISNMKRNTINTNVPKQNNTNNNNQSGLVGKIYNSSDDSISNVTVNKPSNLPPMKVTSTKTSLYTPLKTNKQVNNSIPINSNNQNPTNNSNSNLPRPANVTIPKPTNQMTNSNIPKQLIQSSDLPRPTNVTAPKPTNNATQYSDLPRPANISIPKVSNTTQSNNTNDSNDLINKNILDNSLAELPKTISKDITKMIDEISQKYKKRSPTNNQKNNNTTSLNYNDIGQIHINKPNVNDISRLKVKRINLPSPDTPDSTANTYINKKPPPLKATEINQIVSGLNHPMTPPKRIRTPSSTNRQSSNANPNIFSPVKPVVKENNTELIKTKNIYDILNHQYDAKPISEILGECCICHTNNKNYEKIQCRQCKIFVHTFCYYFGDRDKIGRDNWTCERCEYKLVEELPQYPCLVCGIDVY